MIGAKVGHSLDPYILFIYRLFLRNRIVSPNVLTLLGVFFGLVAFVCTASEGLLAGGIFLFISGFFDLMDGALARDAHRVTPFGGFLDSVLDRYTDLFMLFGIFIHFLRQGSALYSTLTFLAAIGTAIIPYARARAEAASLACHNGLVERPERVVLMVIGLCFNLLPAVVILLAVTTHVTVIQRVVLVKSLLKE